MASNESTSAASASPRAACPRGAAAAAGSFQPARRQRRAAQPRYVFPPRCNPLQRRFIVEDHVCRRSRPPSLRAVFGTERPRMNGNIERFAVASGPSGALTKMVELHQPGWRLQHHQE
ncbi:hypothetical protein [Defluviicoccus vanus]|uniref:Uncharacterized protein n=1 Tax=Defluviicoccus vanus TaxID=111831 RepID=A0A7H1N0H8_9PROT|nr:hypothetical protein [Defluviicoccus vanus]QNT69214.1 hypothetical protein HQ394_07560 [Defluviicoccus vanus]